MDNLSMDNACQAAIMQKGIMHSVRTVFKMQMNYSLKTLSTKTLSIVH
jgi:hypothetical protein